MKDFYDMSSPCMQGGYPRVAEGFQTPNHRIGPHSPPMAWQYPPTMQNLHQSLSSEDRNDSGINSGSDCHSSSPGSESMEGFSSPNSHGIDHQKLGYYSTPIFPKAAYHSSNIVPSTSHVKQEPEDEEEEEKDAETTLTSTPDALKCLEMSVERNLNISAASPGLSETSMDDDKRSENCTEESDDGHKVPRVNSHGKIKTFKCKQCQFVAITKFDFWEHQRQHIKPEKLLTCHKCPFVTEYKHHLEYHLRNHDGSKPFKCEHCDYTCVNKSMLNSHKKSHSNIYQYRCAQCHYASKYCHSLKLHLRKYNHQPAMVLNPDGSPNPLPIIDVYGTRRGPKVKPIHDAEQPQSKKQKTSEIPSEVPTLPLPLQLMTPTPIPLAYSLLQQAMIYQNLERLAKEKNCAQENSTQPIAAEKPHTDTSGALDLTNKTSISSNENEDPALKLDTPSTSSDEEDEENSTTMFANVEVVQNDEEKPKIAENFTCQYCTISFGDAVLYTMHMGYHGYQDPFACNMCGEKCKDKVAFFLHIARTPHS